MMIYKTNIVSAISTVFVLSVHVDRCHTERVFTKTCYACIEILAKQ